MSARRASSYLQTMRETQPALDEAVGKRWVQIHVSSLDTCVIVRYVCHRSPVCSAAGPFPPAKREHKRQPPGGVIGGSVDMSPKLSPSRRCFQPYR